MENKDFVIIESVALEVTRRCNEKCSHCMRGEAQNIDMPKEIVDSLLEKERTLISKLVFSGGEPLLNEDLIIYTIDKIINEAKLVLQIEITTNAKIYSKKLVNKLKEFKYYVKMNFPGFLDLIDEEKISTLRISNDQFHKINMRVVEKYQSDKEIMVIQTGHISEIDDEILLTGRAKNRMFGRYFEYKLNDINTRRIKQGIMLIENKFYITARGNITTQGDGTYEDMDIINLGPIESFEFRKQEKILKKC